MARILADRIGNRVSTISVRFKKRPFWDSQIILGVDITKDCPRRTTSIDHVLVSYAQTEEGLHVIMEIGETSDHSDDEVCFLSVVRLEEINQRPTSKSAAKRIKNLIAALGFDQPTFFRLLRQHAPCLDSIERLPLPLTKW